MRRIAVWNGASMKASAGTKKFLSGFTLLEVLVAMSIMLVFMPILGIVFYQITVLPPGNSMKLSINDEVGQLAAMIYQDGYMADNFTLGTGNKSLYPYYYGNFSWIDYSTNPPNQYVVSYYYPCINSSNSSCNHIVRQVTVTQVQPTPTSTSTATPAPTPTPSPTPLPTTYTYCNNWGTDKWAWGRTWSNAEWFQVNTYPKHPSSPSDFFGSYSYPLLTANSSIYSAICSIGGAYWMQADSPSTPAPWEDSQLYTIKVYQGRSITNLSVTYIGRGPDAVTDTVYYLQVYLWDTVNSSWTRFVYVNGPGGSTVFHTYTFSITSNPGVYVDAGSGNVNILVSADWNPVYEGPPGIYSLEGVYTDYIEVDVN